MTQIIKHAFGTTEYLNKPIKLENVYLPSKYNPKFKSLLVKITGHSILDKEQLKNMILSNANRESLSVKISQKTFNKLIEEKQKLIMEAKCKVDLICTLSRKLVAGGRNPPIIV